MVSISRALTSALKEAPLLPRDAATVALAKEYAALIDSGEPEALSVIGPKLLATLAALGMTPAGRGVKGGTSATPVTDKLDELRARREKRTRVGHS